MSNDQSLQPYDLRVERQGAPIGVDRPAPLLSWKLAGSGRDRRQAGYRIRLVDATVADPADESVPALWDSGDIASDTCVDVPYEGAPLPARSRFAWVVRVVDERGHDSGWSEPATFETALAGAPAPSASEGAWGEAEWIGSPAEPGAAGTRLLDVIRHPNNVCRIWLPRVGGRSADGDPAVVWFRTGVRLPAGKTLTGARLVADAGPAEVRARFGGREVPADGTELLGSIDPAAGSADAPDADDAPETTDSRELMIEVDATDAVSADRPAGLPPALAARLELQYDGLRRPVRAGTDGSWEVSTDRRTWQLAEEYAIHAEPPFGRAPITYRPSPYLRKEFELTAPVRHARLYATALGVYEARINGTRVGDAWLSPGWTDYHHRLHYQVHDVTALLNAGPDASTESDGPDGPDDSDGPRANVLGMILADGWYAGYLGWLGPFQYGERRALLARLEIEQVDGVVHTICSDGSWRVGTGELCYADPQMGEVVDHRLDPVGWDRPGFDDSGWESAVSMPAYQGRLEAAVAPPIEARQELSPRTVRRRGPGRFIVDFGQNVVGRVRLRVRGPGGHRVTLRHAEVVDHRGELYVEALRTARATDEYVLAGDPDGETYEPRFTVHGFRYCEIVDHPGDLDPADVTAVVTYAAMEPIGEFGCSDPGLDRLQQNIVWGQRGNFLAVPTDCPQRDERLGWTGDAQVFAATAAFNYDVRGFLGKWMLDLRDGQHADGGVPHVAPDVMTPAGDRPKTAGSAGWGDAIIIVPHALYTAYGDRRAVVESYESVAAWMEYLVANSDGYIRPDERFGDWLALVDTPKHLVNTAYFAHAARLATELAEVAGRDDDVRRWLDVYDGVRAAFRARYLHGGGRVTPGTQAAYVLALHFGLFDPDEEPRAAANLVEEIAGRNWHLTTGFLGTPYLLDVLCRFGHEDAAFRLLMQDSYPSWLYPVLHGSATTVWERWDSWHDSRGFQNPSMTSFNHYAYGCVGDWIYRNVGGVAAAEPGYRRVLVRPRPGGGITWAGVRLESPYGPIASRWEIVDGRFGLRVELPPNTTGEVWLPAATDPIMIGSGTHTFDQPA